MKTYLFLYPFEAYIQVGMDNIAECKVPIKPAVILKRFNKIIDVRYRRQGYKIVWLTFGCQNDKNKPNTQLFDKQIVVKPNEPVISNGVVLQPELKRATWVYPDSLHVLKQLGPMENLVMGGFHLEDCVDKIAQAAYGQGIPTYIDEDTTDWFFKYVVLARSLPPSTRTPGEYMADLINTLRNFDDSPAMVKAMVQEHKHDRQQRPWLAQVNLAEHYK